MLKQEDFKWKEHHSNNIPDNPIDEYYCIIDTGAHARKYSIQEQMANATEQCSPLQENSYICPDEDEPEYFILFESSGNKATDKDKENMFYKESSFDEYVFGHDTFIRVFKTMEEAKEQAYKQYKAIYGYVLAHIVDDVEEATSNHFCVTN